MKKYLILLCLLSGLSACQTQQETDPVWTQKAAGIWNVSVGSPESLNLLSELHLTPKIETINQLGEVELPISRDEIKFQITDGKTYIRFPLEKGEKIFGLGLNFKRVEQRGHILRLHVDHYRGEDNGRTHAPVPFFVSSKGYGALINSARYIDLWVGTGVRKDSKNPPAIKNRNADRDWDPMPYSDNLEILVPAGGVDIILVGGPTMQDVVRRFNLYNGGGALPPRWGLGFWHRVPTLFSDKEIMAEVGEFEKRGFPLSVIGLEPGWMSRAYPCTYEWDSSRFPAPDRFVQELNDKNIKTNLWINPYVSPDGELYEKIKPYTGSHTVWCGIVPDYTLPETQKIITEHWEKHQLSKGVSGYKMDENDGYDGWLWPDVATFPSGHPAEQIRQVYGAIMQEVNLRMFRKHNRRTYGLVRGSNAGTSSYPYVIYNDYYNHRDFITALINSSFIGVLWTPEVRSSKSAEEWLRRMQTVCFSPLAMLDAWADGTKPWSFPEVTREVNEIAKLRMQLIPYLYTAFADYSFQGIPPIRAMNLEEGYSAEGIVQKGALDATENPYAMAICKEVKDQFMVGPSLLVAPLFAGEKTRQVILPQGKWYDFYTGEFVGEGEIITVEPGLSKIPVFVKDGGIVPLWPAITKIENKKLPVEVRFYGNKNNSYQLYDDDGESYDYEKGDYTRILLEVNVSDTGEKKGSVHTPADGKVWSFSDYNFRYMTPR